MDEEIIGKPVWSDYLTYPYHRIIGWWKKDELKKYADQKLQGARAATLAKTGPDLDNFAAVKAGSCRMILYSGTDACLDGINRDECFKIIREGKAEGRVIWGKFRKDGVC